MQLDHVVRRLQHAVDDHVRVVARRQPAGAPGPRHAGRASNVTDLSGAPQFGAHGGRVREGDRKHLADAVGDPSPNSLALRSCSHARSSAAPGNGRPPS